MPARQICLSLRTPTLPCGCFQHSLCSLVDVYMFHGAAVIEEVRKTKPHIYLQVVASLLLRKMQVERTSMLSDIIIARRALLVFVLLSVR
jgi:hypothetical protein